MKKLDSRRMLTGHELCGNIDSAVVLDQTDEPYELTCDVTIAEGASLTIEPGVTVNTSSTNSDIYNRGRLSASDAAFTGQTEIWTYDTGHTILDGLSNIEGHQLYFYPESQGTITNSQFRNALLYVESNQVTVDGNVFASTSPVRTIPSHVDEFYDNTFVEDTTLMVGGTTSGDSIWKNTANITTYQIVSDVTIQDGDQITVEPGVTVNTPSTNSDIYNRGRLSASDAAFTGQTEIWTYDTGNTILDGLTNIEGEQLYFYPESQGTITNSQFRNALLYVDSNQVTIDGNTFRSASPVRTIPSHVEEFYDNTFVEDTTLMVGGRTLGDSTWQNTANITTYQIVSDVTIQEGDQITVEPGVTVNTPSTNSDIYNRGRLSASDAAFTGQTEIWTYDTGNAILDRLSNIEGQQLYFYPESQGTITNSQFRNALLYVDSSQVSVDGNTFGSASPVRTIPSHIDEFYDNTFVEDTTLMVGGRTLGDSIWKTTSNITTFQIVSDVTIQEGDQITVEPSVTVNTPSTSHEIYNRGRLSASETAFTGQTEIWTYDTGNAILDRLSNIEGQQLYFYPESQGAITNSQFRNALLYVESNQVTVDGNTFGSASPVRTIPSHIDEFYDNTFVEDTTLMVGGRTLGDSIWKTTSNITTFQIVSDVTIQEGDQITIEPDVTVNTPSTNSDIYNRGRLSASETAFTGQTEIWTYDTGNAILDRLSNIEGQQLYFYPESQGTITNSQFRNALLYVDSDQVTVDGNTFRSASPVRTIPSHVDEFYDNTFVEDTTLMVGGTTSGDSIWKNTAIITTYQIVSDVTIQDGDQITVEPGVTVNTPSTSHEIYNRGRLSASETAFTGQTEIWTYETGIGEFQNSSFRGEAIQFRPGSSGNLSYSSIGNLEFYTDSSSDVAIACNDFSTGSIHVSGSNRVAIDLMKNHWGDDSNEQIERRITDYADDARRPTINFEPKLEQACSADLGGITGLVFADWDGSGTQDQNELGIADATVFVDLNGNGKADSDEPSAKSGLGGRYVLNELAPGEHSISIIPPEGWGITGASTFQATVDSARVLLGQNFGLTDSLPGDLNTDSVIDVRDIDLLCARIQDDSPLVSPKFDLDHDVDYSRNDIQHLVEEIMGTSIGDSNLDGVFNSSDFVHIFILGEYEDGIEGNSSWQSGDWNCDGEFDSKDIVFALQRGGYSLV